MKVLWNKISNISKILCRKYISLVNTKKNLSFFGVCLLQHLYLAIKYLHNIISST